MEYHDPSWSFAIALGAGVAAQLVARHVMLPSIVLLLGTGVALGPDGLGVVDPRRLGDGLFALVSLAVAIILFEGGLNLDLSRLRRAGGPVRGLVTVGALVTALGGGIVTHEIMGWSWGLSVLFGTLVIVTGPTVIRPLLRNVPLRPRLATVLEAEGLLIDPVGAIVAAVTLQLVTAPALPLAAGAVELAARVGFGTVAGLVSGLLLVGLLRWRRAVPEGMEDLLALGLALVTFVICEQVLTESGILAVTVAGVVVGNLERRLAEELGEFQEYLTVGLIGMLFVLLAADVRVEEVRGLGLPGLLTVAALGLLVRPAGVLLCTLRSGFSWREKAFLSWVAPRGVVAAAIASLAAALLDELGQPGGHEIRALVFLTIGVTVVVQGGTAPLVARVLGVRAPGRSAIVILGADELALALGGVLRESDRRVVFADSNPQHCLEAEERGFPVVYGNAFAERTLARMRLDRAQAVIGTTPNHEVNHHFAGEARDQFGVRETYVAVNRQGGEVAMRMAGKQGSRILFDRPKDVERWNVRFRHGAARRHDLHFVGTPEDRRPEPAEGRAAPTEAGRAEGPLEREGSAPPREELPGAREGGVDPYVLLAVRRGERGRWQPMHREYEAEVGDVVAAAIHEPERAAALSALARLGWEPMPGGSEEGGGEETATSASPDGDAAQPAGKPDDA